MLQIAVILLSLLVSGAAYSDNPTSAPTKSVTKPKTNTAQYENISEANKRGTKEFPAIIEISKSPVIQVETTDKTEKHRDYLSSEWWMVYITSTLALITLGLAIYTARLWGATNTLAKGAEDTARRQLRAYISAVPNYVYFSTGTSRITITTQIINHGQTPASEVCTVGIVRICPYPLPNDFPFPDMPSTKNKGRSVRHPNAKNFSFKVSGEGFSELEKDNAIRGETSRIYIFGITTYVDIFNKECFTKFCSSIVGGDNLRKAANGEEIKEGGIGFEPTERYNEAK